MTNDQKFQSTSAGTDIEVDDESVEVELDAAETEPAADKADKGPAKDAPKPDAEADGDDAGDDDDKPRDGESDDDKRERRRVERRARKERQRAYQIQQEQMIRALEARNQALERQLTSIDERVTKRDATDIDAMARQAQMQAQRAREAYAKAVQDGNGDAAWQAQREYQQAEQTWNYAHQARQKPRPTPDAQQAPDPVISHFVETFRTRFPWYGKPGYEAETQRVTLMESSLAQSGSNIRTEQHWTDLEAVIRAQFRSRPDLLKQALDDMEDAKAAEDTAPARKAPPVAGRVDARPGKVTVRIPASMQRMMDAANLTKESRDKLIRDYAAKQKSAS